MIKYFIPLVFLLTSNAFAYVEDEQPSYEDFVTGIYTYKDLLLESIAAKDLKKACIYNEMTVNFLINNIKYAEQFNQAESKTTYQDILKANQSDYYNNKEGCDRLLSQ